MNLFDSYFQSFSLKVSLLNYEIELIQLFFNFQRDSFYDLSKRLGCGDPGSRSWSQSLVSLVTSVPEHDGLMDCLRTLDFKTISGQDVWYQDDGDLDFFQSTPWVDGDIYIFCI